VVLSVRLKRKNIRGSVETITNKLMLIYFAATDWYVLLYM